MLLRRAIPLLLESRENRHSLVLFYTPASSDFASSDALDKPAMLPRLLGIPVERNKQYILCGVRICGTFCENDVDREFPVRTCYHARRETTASSPRRGFAWYRSDAV